MIKYWLNKQTIHTSAIERLRTARDASDGAIREEHKRGLVFHGGELRIANTAIETFKR